MVSTLSSAPAWSRAIIQPDQPFGPVILSVKSGQVPNGLNGSLYLNGAGRLERGKQRVGHWFDGDGAVLAIHFRSGQATGVYRYVQTSGYQAEAEAGQFLFGGYGMTPSGWLWERWQRGLKNAANTSVLAVQDRLLALWEGDWPYALDLTTLATKGRDPLNGLEVNSPFSAHPKRDPQTGYIYNIGVSLGQNPTLRLYRCDAWGRLQQHGAIPISRLFLHDFVMADRYLVFVFAPLQLNFWPLLFQVTSFSDALVWHPENGTEIMIVDRETFSVVSQFTTEPWFQWHFGNGYLEGDGSISLDVVRYPDFSINRRLKEVAHGKTTTSAPGALWRIRLDPQGQLLDTYELLGQSCEFPSFDPAVVGQPHRYTYLSLHRSGTDLQSELLDTVGCFDHQTSTLTVADYGDGYYPSEPIFVRNTEDPEHSWLLILVFNSHSERSEIWILDAAHVDEQPLCCLELPQKVSLRFHGTWHASQH